MKTNQPVNPQAILLNLKLSTEEATMILNKLNSAQFVGFTESSLALSILGKIQNANKIPASSIGPTATQMKNIKQTEPSNVSQLREVLGKDPKKAVNFTSPPPVIEEKEDPIDEEDNRPGPPLKALDEAREKVESQDDSPPPEDAGVFSVIDRSSSKDGTDKYI
jgi:hypothetical protein